MYKLNRSSLKEVGLVGTIFGSLLVGFSAITQSAVAQPRISQINPCPRIFYEEPHRNRVMVPAGCPPNAATLRLAYQAIGHTQPRYLAGGQEFVLRDLPTPISITLVRQDGGLLKVMPMSTSEGTLAVSLDETTNFDNNQGVLRIQKDGQVFLN